MVNMASVCATVDVEKVLGIAKQCAALAMGCSKLPIRALLIGAPRCCKGGIHGHLDAVGVKALRPEGLLAVK